MERGGVGAKPFSGGNIGAGRGEGTSNVYVKKGPDIAFLYDF